MKFYLLHKSNNLSERKRAEWADGTHWDKIICSEDPGHMRSSGKRITPLYINLPDNKDDIIWSWYADCIINEKVVQLLAEKSITGYELEDVHIVKDKRKGVKNKLFTLVPMGDGGHIDPSSGYKIIKTYPCCGRKEIKHYEKGLIVDENQWDKSDIFTLIEYPKYILVTAKVKQIFEENRVTGCQFFPAETWKAKY